jgi:uncharacterized membrane protein
VKRINPWFWIPFILGSLLRLAWIWTQPLWYDENFTLAVLRLPLDRMWTAILGDVHPPLFYLLYKPFALLDLPTWILRIPSVLLSILSLWLAWKVFGLLAEERGQRVAFLLFSLGASASIFYAQEYRMYSLLTVLLLLAALAMLQRRWVWFGVSCLALLYTQNYGLLYVPSLWLAGVLCDRRDWKKLTFACLCAATLYIPWIPVLFQQQATLSAGYWITPFSLGVGLYDLYHAFIQKGTFQMEMYCLVIFFAWFSYSFFWHLLHKDRQGWITAAIAFGPWLLACIGSIVLGSSIMHYRSLVPLSPFIALWLSTPLLTVHHAPYPDCAPLPTPDARRLIRSLPLS